MIELFIKKMLDGYVPKEKEVYDFKFFKLIIIPKGEE